MNYSKKWRLNNPEKVKAHWKVSNAIRYGKLKRMPCVICGNPKSHAHHEDYKKPLLVTWLCHKCHWTEHGWVKKERKETGKRTRSDKKKTFHLLKEATMLKKDGYKYRDIATKLNISSSTIYKWLNKTKYK